MSREEVLTTPAADDEPTEAALGEVAATHEPMSGEPGEAENDVIAQEVELAARAAEMLETNARLEADLIDARARADEMMEKYQRMAAEFQNARRRQERQLAEEIERANVRLLTRLLPVLDDLDLAFANVPAAVAEDAWVAGLQQIQKKLRGVLEDDGLQEVPVGGEFDPAHHEALASIPSDTTPSGHVVDALRTGYTYKDKVLRPALVRVAQ
jgi:molecular chaperone GrpE